MRESRQSGSEGGERLRPLSYPYHDGAIPRSLMQVADASRELSAWILTRPSWPEPQRQAFGIFRRELKPEISPAPLQQPFASPSNLTITRRGAWDARPDANTRRVYAKNPPPPG